MGRKESNQTNKQTKTSGMFNVVRTFAQTCPIFRKHVQVECPYNSEYDQEIRQSHTADQITGP